MSSCSPVSSRFPRPYLVLKLMTYAPILGYHSVGTCKVGKHGDPWAVMNSRLRVRGVSGLRVVDVSVMPMLNSGHPQMVAYVVGDKAVGLVKVETRLY